MIACESDEKTVKAGCGGGYPKWIPSCPFKSILFGSVLLISGFLLGAEIIRILWLIGSGLFVLAGLAGISVMIVRDRD